MKATIRRNGLGLSIYISRKDVEEPVVAVENEDMWGGLVLLGKGLLLALPNFPLNTSLPLTIEARKRSIGAEAGGPNSTLR
ncbi:putative nitrogen fixation protein NifT [Rhizobium leguminosarum]|uniref:putative nitrogen fixation protein NifT n=1 Tax=Rhizobium leguminosarum TaxID=384 RepID=UPI001AE8B798|nr:putative nitrogen fixation protein NifT [Rhizobium leguminosarum]MBP2444266.1 nitrogen fixation protein NifT [Rhizobium leguminosarum]